MLQRIKRIIQLSKKDPEALEKLTDIQISNLPEDGDGKATYIGIGTEKEFKEQEDADKGLKGIFGL